MRKTIDRIRIPPLNRRGCEISNYEIEVLVERKSFTVNIAVRYIARMRVFLLPVVPSNRVLPESVAC